MPRQGPGDNKSTNRAYEALHKLQSKPKILDVGCGPGMQTIEIAKNTDGQIYALDTHKPFLDQLNESEEEEKVKSKIKTIQG